MTCQVICWHSKIEWLRDPWFDPIHLPGGGVDVPQAQGQNSLWANCSRGKKQTWFIVKFLPALKNNMWKNTKPIFFQDVFGAVWSLSNSFKVLLASFGACPWISSHFFTCPIFSRAEMVHLFRGLLLDQNCVSKTRSWKLLASDVLKICFNINHAFSAIKTVAWKENCLKLQIQSVSKKNKKKHFFYHQSGPWHGSSMPSTEMVPPGLAVPLHSTGGFGTLCLHTTTGRA